MSALSMTAAERKAFLARPHEGILSIPRADGAPPSTSPVWFHFDGQTISIITSSTSEKARLLVGRAASVTFLVHDEAPPQRYVAVEGLGAVVPADPVARREIAERYVPAEMIEDFLAMTPSEDMVTIRITPMRWRTSDFSKLGAPQAQDLAEYTEGGYGSNRSEGRTMPGYTMSKDELLKRLRRIEGQARGVAQMVEDDRYCIDVLTQISAIRSALESVAIGLVDDHVRHCVADAVVEGGPKADERLSEATAAIARLLKS